MPPGRLPAAQRNGGFLAVLILLTLIAVPLVEIAIFIEVGGLIGPLPTVGLVVAIALAGTWLLRRQGLGTLAKAQASLNRGKMPVAEVLDGFMLIFAALLMVTPGLLTDAIGLLLLVPMLRRRLGRMVARWAMARGTVGIYGMDISSPRGGAHVGPIIEGEAEPIDGDDDDPKAGHSPWLGDGRNSR
jgi:UPF0716 protein FxsA